MASSGSPTPGAIKRLQKEYKQMRSNPPHHIDAAPDESNILQWYYVLEGPKDTPYEGGVYVGKVKFPPDYPFAPPSIQISTPNGRFNPDQRLCLSMSDFHPKEWNPVWSVATILNGLLSFMLEDRVTHGSMESSVEYKQEMAVLSHQANLKLPHFKQLFPQWAEFCEQQVVRITNIALDVAPVADSPQRPVRASKASDKDAATNTEVPELKVATVKLCIQKNPQHFPKPRPKKVEGGVSTNAADGSSTSGDDGKPAKYTWTETFVRWLQVLIVGSIAALLGVLIAG